MSQGASNLTEKIYVASELGVALRQCEVISGLILHCLDLKKLSEQNLYEVNPVSHPFSIALSQDCDLDQAPRTWQGQDPAALRIPNILFCEAHLAAEKEEDVRTGRNTELHSRLLKEIQKNKVERFHFLQKVLSGDDALGEGIGELIIDFKRYFTVPAGEVYFQLERGAKRRCRLVSPYRDHLSSRFSNFLSRIALPSDHQSD